MTLLQEITVTGCIACKHFEEWWKTASADFPNVKVERINMDDPGWQEMVSKYHIMASPGIIINGELFSSGGVNTVTLAKKLKEIDGKQ